MELGAGEGWFDVTVLFAGLAVPAPIELAPDVQLQKIVEANLIATGAKTAADVMLQMPSELDDPIQPICGIKYRVLGKRKVDPFEDGQEISRYNKELFDAPKRAFARTVILLQRVGLADAGTFVYEITPTGDQRIHRTQFNYAPLSVNYTVACFLEKDADELRMLFAELRNPYMTHDGASIGIAIDRLGSAGTRSNAIDANIDLCIAAEIAYGFGMDSRNTLPTLRENAKLYFSDNELMTLFNRKEVGKIVVRSYEERGDTMHGRQGSDRRRNQLLAGLNEQLRLLLQRTLRAYVERRPSANEAARSWQQRKIAISQGRPLGPIFMPDTA